MRTFYKILLIISTIFVLHVCDSRSAINPGENAEVVIQLMLSENSGDNTISLSDQIQTKTIKPTALTDGGVALKNITIEYRIFEGPGSLNKPSEISDSTITLTINLNDFNQNTGSPYVIKVEGTVKAKPSIKDTIIFTEESITNLTLREQNEEYGITLTSSNQYKSIIATAIDANSAQLNNISIEYNVIDGFATLSESESITDSTVTLTINVDDFDSNSDQPFIVKVEGKIKENDSVRDTIIFSEQIITELILTETSGNYNISLGSNQDKTLEAIPLDENQTIVKDINIGYRILDQGPGFLSDAEALSDSSVVLIINLDGSQDESNTIIAVEARVLQKTAIRDTVYFIYNEFTESSGGGISVFSAHDTIPYINEYGNLIESTLVFASLLDTIGNPIPDQWIEFSSIIDSTGSNNTTWIPFGTMTPEMALTNELGFAQAIFQSATKTGFGRIVANTLSGLADTTVIYVSPSEAITLEILPPSPDNEISVMGGGNLESAQITAEVRDGNGNLVNQEYQIRFTIPCDYPIDGGFCPIGDGDFSNDIKINGIIIDASDPHEPTDIVTTVNGQASITLNSGNRPGSVKLRAELFKMDDDMDVDDPIAIAEETPITIVTGMPSFGVVGYAFMDTDTIGGGLFEMPVSCMLWDVWSNPVADCTNVWFSIDPPESAVIIGEAKTGNENPDTGNSYPGVAWTTMQWSSMQVFEQPFINVQTYGVDQNGYPMQLTISSEDNIVGYQNPLEGATLTIQPISPTVKDFCGDANNPLQVIVRGTLRGPYGVPISGGQIQMVIYDAIAFEYIADDGQNPPSLASQTQISNAAGLVTWVIDFPSDNCYNTNPDDPDEFDCAAPTMIANLYDPNNATSEEISITLIRSCE